MARPSTQVYEHAPCNHTIPDGPEDRLKGALSEGRSFLEGQVVFLIALLASSALDVRRLGPSHPLSTPRLQI